MTKETEPEIDWSLTGWKGSRLEQHRAFYALPFSRKLEIIEQMAEWAAQFAGKQTPTGSRRSPPAAQQRPGD